MELSSFYPSDKKEILLLTIAKSNLDFVENTYPNLRKLRIHTIHRILYDQTKLIFFI